ncbi:restriction endonuclease subunit S [Moritella sp. Urea-trap-13]|uniref:restriction endonuclease subunit S n=1 Tax=Moritella sp. Urea-trap-13 TaxID=2058327 RepID=UPI000C347E53|nr:restriction endonuclease subunit S [Moritella sp. Urea-trap-13]PKH07124.1 hypothetical protein CXF93_14755 [Moritella sp. Urea-trap-13]
MSWPMVKLGDIATFINGDRGKNYPSKGSFVDTGVPFINAGNLSSNHTIKENELNYVTQEKYDSLSSGKIDKNDILFCLRGSLGKFAIVDSTMQGAIASSLVIIRSNEKVNLNYLKHYLGSVLCQREINFFENGAAQPNLSATDLKGFKVPLPPLEGQKRIAAILDKADGVRQKRKQAIDLTDDFLRSVFLDMFGDPVNNTRRWTKKSLNDVLTSIDSGKSPVCESRPAEGDEWSVLKLSAVTSGNYLSSANKAYLQASELSYKHEVKKGDVLFTRKNTKHLVAAVAYVFESEERRLMPDLIFRLNVKDKEILDPLYLSAVLSNTSQRSFIQSLAGGAAGSMPNISKAKLIEVEIPIPPIALQRKFASIVQHVRDNSKKKQESHDVANSFFDSLSQKAFSGQL